MPGTIFSDFYRQIEYEVRETQHADSEVTPRTANLRLLPVSTRERICLLGRSSKGSRLPFFQTLPLKPSLFVKDDICAPMKV